MGGRSDGWESFSWDDIVPRLTLFAVRLLRKRGLADMTSLAPDLAQTAIEKVLSGDRVWDQEKEADLFRFLTSVVSSLISHEMERYRRYRAEELDSDVEYESPFIENEALARLEIEKFLSFARERDRDVYSLAYLSIVMEISDREEQERVLGVETHHIYNIRRRLQRMISDYHRRGTAS